MTQFASLSLKNQAAVETVFTVEGINYQTNVASWVNVGASYDASRRATFSLVPPTSRSSRARTRVKVTIPIMDTVVPTMKVDELIANVELICPKISTLASRQDLRAFIADFLTDAVIINAIENYESVY